MSSSGSTRSINENTHEPRSTGNAGNAGTASWLPTANSLLSAFAHGLLTAAFLLMLVVGLVISTDEGVIVAPPRLGGLVAYTAVLVLAFFKADAFNAIGYRKLIITGVTLGLIDLVFILVIRLTGVVSWLQGWPLQLGVTVVFGTAIGLALLGWGGAGRALTSLDALTSNITASFITGVFLIVATASDDTLKLINCVIYLVIALMVVIVQRRGSEDEEPISRKTSIERLKLDWRSSISYAVTSIGMGMMFVVVWGQFPQLQAAVVTGGSYLVASVAVYVVSHYRGASWVLLGPVERWTFPVIITVLLLAVFLGFASPAAPMLTMILLFVFSIRDLSRIITRSLLTVEHQVQVLYLFARATIPMALGLCVGCFLGLVSLQLGADAAKLILGFLIFLFAVAVTLVPYGEDPLVMPEKEAPAASAGQQDPAQAENALRHTWRRACDKVCDDHNLTPREREVFRMLTRGRTAKVIARDLNISVYTVKSHTYNIYRKLDVESQQELIDMVMDMDSSIAEYLSKPQERITDN